MDRIDAMQAFVAVADLRGFAPAARKLGLSPSGVTRLVAALEDRLGGPAAAADHAVGDPH
jgi:DNA-binding transcriptional LysR family regulator